MHDGEPRRLDAFVDRVGRRCRRRTSARPGSVVPYSTNVPDDQQQRHQRGADAERGQRHRAEMADDRGVDSRYSGSAARTTNAEAVSASSRRVPETRRGSSLSQLRTPESSGRERVARTSTTPSSVDLARLAVRVGIAGRRSAFTSRRLDLRIGRSRDRQQFVDVLGGLGHRVEQEGQRRGEPDAGLAADLAAQHALGRLRAPRPTPARASSSPKTV